MYMYTNNSVIIYNTTVALYFGGHTGRSFFPPTSRVETRASAVFARLRGDKSVFEFQTIIYFFLSRTCSGGRSITIKKRRLVRRFIARRRFENTSAVSGGAVTFFFHSSSLRRYYYFFSFSSFPNAAFSIEPVFALRRYIHSPRSRTYTYSYINNDVYLLCRVCTRRGLILIKMPSSCSVRCAQCTRREWTARNRCSKEMRKPPGRPSEPRGGGRGKKRRWKKIQPVRPWKRDTFYKN